MFAGESKITTWLLKLRFKRLTTKRRMSEVCEKKRIQDKGKVRLRERQQPFKTGGNRGGLKAKTRIYSSKLQE